MKFETFSFHCTQAKYVKVAVDHITNPQYNPDGLTPLQVSTMLSDADTEVASYMDRFDALNVARGELEASAATAHDAAVDVYACMKSCYRKNRGVLASIRRLTKDDRTSRQTLLRVKSLSRRWAQLPAPPGGGIFQVGAITMAAFNLLRDDLDQKINTFNDCTSQFVVGQVGLREMDENIAGFVTAALAQGRAIYREGTAERAYIDAVSVESSTQPPDQTVIEVAESPAADEVILEFSAESATSFSVWHKGPGDAQYLEVGQSLVPGEYSATGLPAGAHAYQAVGQNSRGSGPASEPAVVQIAAVAVA